MNPSKLALGVMILWFTSPIKAHQLERKIDLSMAAQLKPGKSTKEQAKKLLGKPGEVTDLSKGPNPNNSKDSGEIWEYFEKGQTRLSISFGNNENIVDSWTWYPYRADSEKAVKKVMLKFPDAKWVSETVKWVNPHHYPNECFFTDDAKGVSIEYDRTHEDVSSISEWNPTRKPASTSDDEKPPRFCIENACADGQLSTIVFKDKPLCDLPK
jgi:hypothetical protein